MNYLDIILAIAIVSTLFLILQVILVFVGGDSDVDVDVDVDFDASDLAEGFGLKLLTLKTITTLLVMSSWVFLLMHSLNAHIIASSIVSIVVGILSMVGMSFAMSAVMKLQKDGTSRITTLKGSEGTVSITIRENRTSRGKISIMLQGSLSEIDAESDEELLVGSKVFVTEAYENYVVVKKI